MGTSPQRSYGHFSDAQPPAKPAHSGTRRVVVPRPIDMSRSDADLDLWPDRHR